MSASKISRELDKALNLLLPQGKETMAIENPTAVAPQVSDNAPAPPTNLPDDQKPEGSGSSTPEKIRLTPPEGLFTEVPAEFDPNKHKPLRKKDFADPRTWHRMKISDLESEMKKHKDQIALYDQFGTNPEDIKQARVFNRATEVIKKMLEQQKKSGAETGFDVVSMLSALGLSVGPADNQENVPQGAPQN